MTDRLWRVTAAIALLFCFASTGQGASPVIRVGDMTIIPGQTNRLLISLESTGEVSGLTFNIAYNTNLLKFVRAAAGIDATNAGAALNVNPNQTTNSGFLGLGLGFFSGATFPSGTNVLAEVYFGATAGVTSASTAVTFTNQPIASEVSDGDAKVLPTTFIGGNVFIQCNYSLNTNAMSFTSAAATSSINLTASGACAWTIVNTNPWITITPATNGTGNAPLNFHVTANSSLTARTGMVLVAGQILTVTQAGIICSYALSSPGYTHTAAMETNSFSVIASNPCPWSVSNANAWIVLLSGSGAGNGTVTYAVEANTSLSPRSGVLLIEDKEFMITQQGVSCTYALSSSNYLHSSGSETNSFGVIVNSPCPWSVSNANSWITILAGADGPGNGTVTYSVAPNVSATQRNGLLSIAGQIFSVSQRGIDCSYALISSNATHTSARETNTFSITTSNSCPWSVSNTNGWITLLAGTNGIGDGVVTYSVEANPSPAQRVGTLVVQGLSFVVTQEGIVCSYALSMTSCVHSATVETNSFTLSTANLCPWSIENTNQWITILSGSNGTGSATVTYSVAGNAALSERTATMFIAGKTFSITQQAVVCSYALSASNRTHTASPITSSLNVNAAAPCSWTVDNTNSWITILSGSNGTGNGTITYSLPTNSISLDRTGSLNVNGQVFTITQQGISCTYSISPTKRTHGFGAVASNFFTINCATGCLWSVVNTNPWIHLYGSGTGFGGTDVGYSVDANPSSVQRIGYVTLPGASLLITQRTSCSFTFSPSNLSLNSSASNGTVNVTVGATCSWTATTSDNWITVLGSGTGNSSFSYSVLANPSSASRTGAVVVAGLSLPVIQTGSAASLGFESISVGLSGEVSLIITGGPSGALELQISPDLATWSKLADLTNTTGRVDYVSPGGTNRFYRAVRGGP